MIKLTFGLRRQPSLSREEFQRYWLETHGPGVWRHAGDLRIRRDVQLYTGNEDVNDSAEDRVAATATDAGREAGRILLEDENCFIDLANSPLLLGDEKPLVGG